MAKIKVKACPELSAALKSLLGKPAKRRKPATVLRGRRVSFLTLFLPMPPSSNHYYTVIRGRKAFSKAALAYRKAVAAAMLAQPQGHVGGRAKVVILARFTDRRRCDIDNRIKPTLDALVASGVLADDSQLDDVHITRGDIADVAGVTVWLTGEPG